MADQKIWWLFCFTSSDILILIDLVPNIIKPENKNKNASGQNFKSILMYFLSLAMQTEFYWRQSILLLFFYLLVCRFPKFFSPRLDIVLLFLGWIPAITRHCITFQHYSVWLWYETPTCWSTWSTLHLQDKLAHQECVNRFYELFNLLTKLACLSEL